MQHRILLPYDIYPINKPFSHIAERRVLFCPTEVQFPRRESLYRTTHLTVFFNGGPNARASLSKVFSVHNWGQLDASVKGKKPGF